MDIFLSHLTFTDIGKQSLDNFHSHTVRLDIIKAFYSPTDAQVNCLKNNIKIYIKTAPTCFGAVTPSSGSALFKLAEIIVVKIHPLGATAVGEPWPPQQPVSITLCSSFPSTALSSLLSSLL